MDSGVDGTEETGRERRGQQAGQTQQQEVQVTESADERIRAALAERDFSYEQPTRNGSHLPCVWSAQHYLVK